MAESWESLRGLIEKLVLIPHDQCDGYSIDLRGDLAALLDLASGSEASRRGQASRVSGTSDSQVVDNIEELMLVAGVGFEPTTFRL